MVTPTLGGGDDSSMRRENGEKRARALALCLIDARCLRTAGRGGLYPYGYGCEKSAIHVTVLVDSRMPILHEHTIKVEHNDHHATIVERRSRRTSGIGNRHSSFPHALHEWATIANRYEGGCNIDGR